MSMTIEINGERETADVAPDTPLLWTLRLHCVEYVNDPVVRVGEQ